MQKRYIGLAAAGIGASWFMMGGDSAPKAALEFTKPALLPPAAVDLRAGLSSAYLALPVEIGPLARRAEQALPEKLAIVHDILPDAACAKRTLGYECNNAKLDGSITRSGPVEMHVTASSIRLVVPIKYDLTATGLGWAASLTEHKAGDSTLAIAFAVTINPTGGLDVALRDETPPAEPPLTLLKSTIKLTRLLDQRLKPVIKAAESDLRRTLSELPVKTAIGRAWGVLAAPLELGQGSGLWLKGAPEHYTSGSFVSEQGRMFYRIAIASRMAIAEAERVQSTAFKRQPVASQDSPPPALSSIRIAVPIDLEAMRQIAETTFGRGEVFESRADRFSEPVKVKVKGTRVYPAMRQIGLELDVEVTNHKGVTHTGKLNLAGRPVLDAVAGVVTLADVTFPAVSSKDISSKEASGRDTAAANSRSQAPGVPRVGTEPFASKFAGAAKLDVSRALAEALPRATHMLNQRLGDDLLLSTRLDQAVPVALEMARDGAWLMVDLTGQLVLTYEGANDAAAAAARLEDSREPAAQKPESTAVASGTPAAAATAKRPVPKRTVEVKRPVEPKRSHEVKPEPKHDGRHDAKRDAKHDGKKAAELKASKPSGAASRT